MSAEQLVRAAVEGEIGRLTLARPPLNILTIPMMETASAALRCFGGQSDLKAVVLDAEGRAFSAGVAVEDHVGERAEPMLRAFHQVFRELHAVPCPTVAVVQGAALGGGAELATFCDVVIASETAVLGQPEIKLGVFPPIAALHYPARVGPARALQLLLSGAVLSAREAERVGLVDRVAPADEVGEALVAVLAALTDKSAIALRLTKQAIREARGDHFERALAGLEALYRDELMRTEDAAEGLRAFMERRAPVWTNR